MKKPLPDNVSDLQKMVGMLLKKQEKSDLEIQKVRQEIDKVKQEKDRLETESRLLREEIRLLLAEKFGRHSERFTQELDGIQRWLFEEPAVEEAPPEEPETVDVPAHTRKKPGRKPLDPSLERVEVIHDIPEAEKQCSCGATLKPFDKEISEQLQVIPARIWVERHIRLKYACPACEGIEADGPAVKIAPPPVQMIPKSIASASLLSHILIGKFCDALPFYRQEQQFERYGADLTRASMCNWALHVAKRLEPLKEMLRMDILDDSLVGVDETTVQVLDEPGRKPENKSYMWVFRGGTSGAVYYHYSPTRSADVPRMFLQKYEGIVQTDGYQAYNFLDQTKGIVHMGCWAHARRYFFKAAQSSDPLYSGKSKAKQALEMIQELYHVEKVAHLKGLDEKGLHKERKEKSKQILKTFKEWLDENSPKAPPSSLIGKAFAYVLSQWSRLIRFIDDSRIPLDNNLVENAIRPFVVGRKNWLFAQSVEGAKASALFYSLIETAKVNHLDPYKYLRFLFEQYPLAKKPEDLFWLLPTNVNKVDLDQYQFKSQPPP